MFKTYLTGIMKTEKHYLKKDKEKICFEIYPLYTIVNEKKIGITKARNKWEIYSQNGYKQETSYWFKNRKIHRDNDMPAVIKANEYKAWYKNNQLHRDNDLPTIIWEDGTKKWYKNNLLHRDYG